MLPSTRSKVAVLLTGLTLICAAPVAAQDNFQITFDQARQQGMRAALAGENAIALELADTLLQANPQDGVAWYIRALALSQSGNLPLARVASRNAYIHAVSPEQRFEAAQLTALIAYNEDRLTTSQWWLRLALQSAPTEEAELSTRRNLSDVIRQNPWRTTLSFSIVPSNNVNGGTDDATYTINGEDVQFLGLPFERQAPVLGRALSGWKGSLDLNTQYVLNRTDTTQMALTASLSTQQIWLSDDAQDFLDENLEPDEERVSGDFFNYTYVDTGVEWLRASETGLLSYGLSATALWQSGEHAETGIAASAGFTFPLDGGRTLSVTGDAARNWIAGSATVANDRLGVSLRYRQPIEDIGLFGLSLGYTTVTSPTETSEYDRWSVSADFSPKEPIGPANLTGIIGFSQTDYPVYIDVFEVEPGRPDLAPIPGGRQDQRAFVRVVAAFPAYDYAGFFPVLTLDASRNLSNVGRYERSDAALEFSIQSSF